MLEYSMHQEMKKIRAVNNHLDEVVRSIEESLQISDLHDRRNHLRGVLHYWLGLLFAEGVSHSGDLEVVNEVSKAIIEKLKIENRVLLKRISDSR